MSLSMLWDMWNNKGEVAEGLLSAVTSSFTNPTQEVELGADWDREAVGHNIPVDVGLLAKDIKTVVTHPKEAYEVGTGLLGGAWRHGLEKIMPQGVMDALGKVDEFVGYDSEPDKAIASEAWQGIVATHGGLEELQKYGNEHPVYLAAELSGLGFLARQVSKMVAPAVVKAMEATEMGVSKGLLAIENVADSVESAFPQPYGTQFMAYHGSPDGAIWRNFNFNKIGEAHGFKEAWGLHASGQEATGIHFAGEIDTDLSTAYNHRLQKHLTPIEREIWSDAKWGELPKDVKARMYEKYPAKKAEIDVVMKEFEKMHDKSKAQLYELDIHDDALPFMIRRELPMLQQPLAVQKVMKEHGMSSDMTGQQFYDKIAGDFTDQTGASSGARELASKYLATKGIKGLQFMDDITTPKQKMVDGVLVSEDPMWSYVLFDDTSHTMLTRQGKEFSELPTISTTFADRIGDVKKIEQGLLDPDLLNPIITNVSQVPIEKKYLADYEGYPWVGTYRDVSRTGLLEGYGDTRFGTGVHMGGGQGYMFDEPNVQAGRLWESGEGARTNILNSMIEAQKLKSNHPPLLFPFSTLGTGMDFTHQVTNTMLQSAKANLNKKQLKELDKLIRTTSKDSETGLHINKNWKGIYAENPLEGTTGAERKAISNIIDVNFRANNPLKKTGDNNVLSLPEARLINADPTQLNNPAFTINNFGQFDVNNPVGTTASNESYGFSIQGKPLGTLMEDINLLDISPDAYKKSGERMTRENFMSEKGSGDFRQMTMRHNVGLLTDKVLRRLDDEGKLYGGLLK